MNRGSPDGAAVFSFWTLTSRSRHPSGRGLQVHAVDTEAVKLRELGELACGSFDFVCDTGDFAGVVGDR